MTRQDRTEGFILDQDSITFHTTHYKTHREFIESALLGLETVHKVVTLDFVSRIGMRYLDAVIPREGESVEQYLMPGLHGLSRCSQQKHAHWSAMARSSIAPTDFMPHWVSLQICNQAT